MSFLGSSAQGSGIAQEREWHRNKTKASRTPSSAAGFLMHEPHNKGFLLLFHYVTVTDCKHCREQRKQCLETNKKNWRWSWDRAHSSCVSCLWSWQLLLSWRYRVQCSFLCNDRWNCVTCGICLQKKKKNCSECLIVRGVRSHILFKCASSPHVPAYWWQRSKHLSQFSDQSWWKRDL